MFNTVQALVLREVRYKEADKILTLFTKSDGRITAKARGALRKGSKITAATQQLTYSEMTLFGNFDENSYLCSRFQLSPVRKLREMERQRGVRHREL